MIEVKIYVEGPSDEAAMRALLQPLIERKQAEGISIDFFEAPPGHKKESVLEKVPIRAINILRNNPNAVVLALPDLYPPDVAFPHKTFPELEQGLRTKFQEALKAKGVEEDTRLVNRFKVFCFKHDMEALLLAAEEALALVLEVEPLEVTWTKPVEDQNHNHPPKLIVETLFRAQDKRYIETNHAPLILGFADYKAVAEACPQCFKPLVEFLEGLSPHIEKP